MGIMRTNTKTERAFSVLQRRCERYRLACSAARFFAHLVWLSAPGLVVVITLLFVSKIAWPPLVSAFWLAPICVLAVALYLVRRPAMWRMTPQRAWAVTDLRSGNRGTFMAVQQAGDQQWADGVGGEQAELRPCVNVEWFPALIRQSRECARQHILAQRRFDDAVWVSLAGFQRGAE